MPAKNGATPGACTGPVEAYREGPRVFEHHTGDLMIDVHAIDVCTAAAASESGSCNKWQMTIVRRMSGRVRDARERINGTTVVHIYQTHYLKICSHLHSLTSFTLFTLKENHKYL